MPQSKILVDTNSYLRLAKSIRPLLFVPFGDKEYSLYILSELNEELKTSKLDNKFPWTQEDEFIENRKFFPKIGKVQKKEIDRNFEYIWSYVLTEFNGPSKVDVWYIAYALELNVPVVTDDQDMTELATTFEVQVIPTLELLKIMLDCGHIDMKSINGICDFWRYISDVPANFKSDYKRLFGSY